MGNGSSRDQEDIFDNEVNLFQFKLLRVIGRGSFGKVRMVEKRGEPGTGPGAAKLFALKYISKAQVIKMEAVRNVLRERQILESLDHVFVVNMRFAFQDDEYMYMVMDLMMGGDLRFHMNRRTFDEDTVRFWIAELSSAVTHLHSLGIVHRDIKPDNVLLDAQGHAHLTDFNIGCKLTPEKPFLTSQSGTVAYMAPEVFRGSGYGTSVDWWAIGVLFYECIYNKRPFQTESIADLKKAIPNQTIEFPEKEGLSRECISAMRGFLTRDPKERLGIKGGMEGIRQHPFFQAGAYQTNPENWWYMLESKQLTPKFQPSSEHVNFDATYDLEELLLDDEPLTYRSTRKRAQRLQKEKDKAIKEENARLKAEHEAAAAAAELAMSAMTLANEEYHMEGHGRHASSEKQSAATKKLNKKRSKLYIGGGGGNSDSNCSSTNSSHLHLAQAPAPQLQHPQPQQQQQQQYQQQQQHPQKHHQHSILHQTQFQSIPLSPIEAPGGSRGLPLPPPPLQFPSPPPPSVTRQSNQNVRHNTGAYAQSRLPPPPSQSPPQHPSQTSTPSKSNMDHANPGTTSGNTKGGYSYTASTGYGSQGQGSGVTTVYLSKPALPGSNGGYSSYPGTSPLHVKTSKDFLSEDDPMKRSHPNNTTSSSYHAMQNQHPQEPSTSSSSSSLTGYPSSHLPRGQLYQQAHAQNHPKHIPSHQQPLQQHPHSHQHPQQQQQQQQHVQTPARQPSPSPAINIAAAAAAQAAAGNMTRKEKIAHQMALIDREFTTFDYTVYENYHGLVDPLTMSVGDPPEWVRSRDH